MKVFVEGYGCSANLAETEQIKGFVESKNLELTDNPALADRIIVNTCAVKKRTELDMQNRIRFLDQIKKDGSKIIVSGCLPKANPEALLQIGNANSNIVQTGAELEGIAKELGFLPQSFSPSLSQVRFNSKVGIIPIAKGCLSNCSFCGTKNARGELQSFSIEELNAKFKLSIKETPEIWLASQDNGCYGFDLKTNLPSLVKTLLENKGNFRIRLGMMSPQYVRRYYDEFVSLFKDERVYRFIHLPVQSGNNRILGLMKRAYSIEQFEFLVSDLRRDIGEFSLATDLIVGFPTETKSEFNDTLDLVNRVGFDMVNVARYAIRPNTAAESLPQVSDQEKLARSRELMRLVRNQFLERNLPLVGRTEKVLVSTPAKVGGFVGRTAGYKQVILQKAELGEFALAKIQTAFPTFLKGILV